jgi:hypothetical protein
MKGHTLILGFAVVASANIIFNHVPLVCDWNSTKYNNGCLRGQECLDDGE